MRTNDTASPPEDAQRSRKPEMHARSGDQDDQQEVLVLIAEDEEPIAEVLALIVADAGYLPVTAMHGKAALEVLLQRRPALVITDLMMPYLDGRAFIEHLRTETARAGWPPIPVILMTAADLDYAQTCGADAVLAKPFGLHEVEQLLHQFLAASAL